VHPCKGNSKIQSLTSNQPPSQPGLRKGALCKKLLQLSFLALPIFGLQNVTAAPAPDEVTGIVYSHTTAEIFWPRDIAFRYHDFAINAKALVSA